MRWTKMWNHLIYDREDDTTWKREYNQFTGLNGLSDIHCDINVQLHSREVLRILSSFHD